MNDGIKTFLIYAICFASIISGIFFGITWWQDAHSKSYINGSIDIGDQFYQESFKYSSDKVILYKELYNENDVYSHSENNLAVVPFNGVENKYQIMINDYVIYDATISAGAVLIKFNIDFYDTENNLLKQSYFDLSIRFLSNRTELKISTIGSENAAYIEQYFNDYNCRIKIIENKGETK